MQNLEVLLVRNGAAIQLSGLILDNVVTISRSSAATCDLSCEDVQESNEDLAVHAEFARSCQPYPQDCNLFSAFCHTLIAGRDGSGRERCQSDKFSEVISLLLDEVTGKQPSLPGQTYSPRRLAGRFTKKNLKERTFGRVFQDLRKAYKNAMRHRVLYKTAKLYMGLGPDYVCERELVCIFAGSPVPFILRPLENGTYLLVSETYVHGLMSGEAMDMSKAKEIVLV